MIEALGKYEIRRELARGAMGIVYEAYDPLIRRRVALKTIRPDQLDGERPADVTARFRREAQAAGRLSHPNIVAIHEFAEDGGMWFIAMEFVDGRELRECFASDERFRLPDVERIMSQILDALDYSHRQGVVHRDIKPANIFLLADGTVKVADFGIAHIEASNLTQVGTVVGTPSYMSPEQILGLPIDGRSDLFSAGVILYQFLTGERPFAGSSATTMQKVLKEDPLPPSSLNVQLPPVIDAVVRKALAKRADDRFQTAPEFASALRSALRAGAPAATAAGDPDATVANPAAMSVAESGDRGSPTAPAASAAAAARPIHPARAHPARAVAITAGVAAAGIVVLAAAWWLFPKGPSNAATPATASAAKSPGGSAGAADGAGSGDVRALALPAVTVRPAVAPDVAAAAPVPSRPGTLVISAVGLADPTSARYSGDASLLQADVRADARNQLTEKAVMLLLDRKSFASNYDLLQSRVVSKGGSFVATVVKDGTPQIGKDGLMAMTTEAVVDIEAIRRSLDRMSRDDRVELIRAGGDPRVAVRISLRDADDPNAPAQPSPIAENLLKERIQAFGFRTWTDAADSPGAKDADFVVSGEAAVRKLSTRLAASGLVITKYALASWTVKCTERATGEEIYFNTTMPKATGSWASREAALRAIGAGVADQFSREFFLRHVPVRGRKVALVVTGLDDADALALLAREFIGLPAVITARRGASGPGAYDLEIAQGSGPDAIASDIVRPLNAKLGDACFTTGASAGDRVTLAFDAKCASTLRSRLEANPPASLYFAPPARQKAVVKNPETLRKLMV